MDTPDPDVTIWNIFEQEWQTYQAGVNAYTNETGAGNQFGSEGEFARQYRIAFPERQVAIIKYVANGSRLGGSGENVWNPDNAGELFDDAKTEIIAARAALAVPYQIEAVVWMQGETDAFEDVAYANAYEANLTAFITAVRAEWVNPTTPFHIGRISDSAAWTFRATVRAAQLAVADADPLSDIISTDDYPMQSDGGPYHYNEAGVKLMGEDFFKAHIGTYVFPGGP